MNDHAAAFAKVTRDLKEAITSQDKASLATAARWYLSYPQLFFRNPGSDNKRNVRTIKVRLQTFLSGDYRKVVTFWRKDFDKALAKQRHKSPDTPENRAEQAVKLADKGFISRAAGKIHSKGRADGAEEQMARKHPTTPEHDWPAPAPATVNMVKLKEILRTADPLVGVRTRGMHSDYLKVLATGRMMDADSVAALELFSSLGISYLNGMQAPSSERVFGIHSRTGSALARSTTRIDTHDGNSSSRTLTAASRGSSKTKSVASLASGWTRSNLWAATPTRRRSPLSTIASVTGNSLLGLGSLSFRRRASTTSSVYVFATLSNALSHSRTTTPAAWPSLRVTATQAYGNSF